MLVYLKDCVLQADADVDCSFQGFSSH